MCLPGPRQHGPLDWYGSFAPRRLLRPDPHTGVPSALPCAHPRFAGFSPHPRSRFRPHPDHSLQAQAFAPRPLCRRYSIDCVPHEAVGQGGASRGEGTLCLRRVGGAHSGAQVLLGVISAVTASRGTWAGPVPPCTLLGWSRRGGRWPTASTRPIAFRSRPQRRLHGEACGEGTSCLGRADGAHSSSQALLGVIPSSAASRET